MSNLRTALQFGEIDRLRAQLRTQAQKKLEQKLSESEKLYTRWLTQTYPDESPLEAVAGEIRAFARSCSNLQIATFEKISALGGGWRRETLVPLTPSHEPLTVQGIHAALERFLEWTGDQAFAELHPIEQTALSLARLVEIAPFARLNVPLSGAIGSFWLLRADFVFPIWEYHEPWKYEEYLDAAFRLEMQPLVDYLLRGERDALRVLLAN